MVKSTRKTKATKPKSSEMRTVLFDGTNRATYMSITGAIRPKTHDTVLSRRVWALIQRVPPGRVTTYGQLAKALGNPKLSQAVGNALRNNPYAPLVPCHRVVASSRSLGGFDGQTTGSNIEKKIRMLREENVIIDDKTRKVHEQCIMSDSDMLQLAQQLIEDDLSDAKLMTAYVHSLRAVSSPIKSVATMFAEQGKAQQQRRSSMRSLQLVETIQVD